MPLVLPAANPNVIRTLHNILSCVQKAAGDYFTGVGLLICDAPDNLPILPLRSRTYPPCTNDLIASLAAISVPESEYHDGFHVISSDWKLLRVSQYFSPPIVYNVFIDRTKLFGGRYLAALFGSAIHTVKVAGIASRRFGIAVFKDGSECSFEAAQ
jgi:hypothetical protein